MEIKLKQLGRKTRVIEGCLNGRRTAWDDPFKSGRNGLAGLAERIEAHSPLALVILLLGTNGQSIHCHNAWHSAHGIAALVSVIRHAPIEPGMSVPPILIAVPPLIQAPKGPIKAKFLGREAKCVGLADAYQAVALANDCEFVDCNSITSSSRVDGVHLDADQHLALGQKMAEFVRSVLVKTETYVALQGTGEDSH